MSLSPASYHVLPEQAIAEGAQLVRAVKRGLPAERFDALRDGLGITTDTLLRVSGLSSATLSRRRKQGHFDTFESERLLRIARVFDRAVDVFGGAQPARAWLLKPSLNLDEAVPLEYADTEVGARQVEDVLGRIEYGLPL